MAKPYGTNVGYHRRQAKMVDVKNRAWVARRLRDLAFQINAVDSNRDGTEEDKEVRDAAIAKKVEEILRLRGG